MGTKISGAHIELYEVTDPDGTPSETLIGKTTGDIELSNDVVNAENRDHNSVQSTRKPIAADKDMDLEKSLETDAQGLIDLNLLDDSQSPPVLRAFTRTEFDALRLDVYLDPDDTSTNQEWLIRSVYLLLDGITWNFEDFAALSPQVIINGDVEAQRLDATDQ